MPAGSLIPSWCAYWSTPDPVRTFRLDRMAQPWYGIEVPPARRFFCAFQPRGECLVSQPAPASPAREVQPAQDEGVEHPVRSHHAVSHPAASLPAIGLEVDQVFLLLRPDQLDQAAEGNSRLDRDPVLFQAFLDRHREVLRLGQVQALQRLQQVVEPAQVIPALRLVTVRSRCRFQSVLLAWY